MTGKENNQYLRDKAVLKDNNVIHMRQKADAMRN